MGDGDQVRVRRQVVVPQIMAKRLEMPESFAGAGVEAERAIGKQVITFARAPIEIGRGSAGADEHQPALLVHTGAAPIIRRAGVGPATLFPSLVTEFARPRDGVKSPKLFAGPRVKRARVAGRRRAAFG